MLIFNKKSPEWIKKETSSFSKQEAKHQDIRPLRIGVINYMPDAALEATEKDFLRPLIEASGSHQFNVQFFSPDSVKREGEALQHTIDHYTEVTREKLSQCDILIHTGANDLDPDGTGINFQESKIAKEMIKNYELANESGVTTQVASCLSSQVIAHHKYNIPISSSINEYAIREKITGVFNHSTTEEGENNYITKELNDEYNVVYSRNHRLLTEEIRKNPKLISLIESIPEKDKDPIETHLFIDPQNLFFGFQGHPEYQKNAIYKEFLRDVGLYFKFPERYTTFPAIPPRYFSKEGLKKVEEFKKETEAAVKQKLNGEENISRPQLNIDTKREIKQTWRDTADKIWARIFNATYQLTGFEAGEKLTKKRGISELEHPLEALL